MRKAIMLITLLMTAMHAMSQQFIHLTDEQLRIDSVSVPSYTQTTPLDGAWRDSSYVVSIVYPEFRDMTAQEAADYLRYNALKPGEMPSLHSAVSYDRKSPSLYTSFCPVVSATESIRCSPVSCYVVRQRLRPQARQRPWSQPSVTLPTAFCARAIGQRYACRPPEYIR